MRYAIIVAAGRSDRYGKDKLQEDLLGKSVLQHSVDIFKRVADVVVVVGRNVPDTLFAEGGETRFLSVCNGLSVLPSDGTGTVAVHDGARPFITEKFVRYLYEQAELFGSAVPRLPITDTLYRVANDSPIPVERDEFFTVQTPQVFDFQRLLRAFERLDKRFDGYTDESTLWRKFDDVHFAEGARGNIKITYQGDIPQFRVGVGFDVHPFVEGDGVLLGGVKIPFDKKLFGHSDADVLCHAICDAILSASDNSDIGTQFPDSDPRYSGIDSTLLLERCVELADGCGFEVVNVSAVVVCQAPKISPFAEQIERKLATILRIPPECVNLSATTTEHLGALGNGDGIAAQANALLRKRPADL